MGEIMTKVEELEVMLLSAYRAGLMDADIIDHGKWEEDVTNLIVKYGKQNDFSPRAIKLATEGKFV